MDLSDENENAAKFLVPEIVRRSRTAVNVKINSKHLSPHIEKVFLSKKRHIAKLKEQYQLLSDVCCALEKKQESSAVKENFLLRHCVSEVKKGEHYKMARWNLDEEHIHISEAYETVMQPLDQKLHTFLDIEYYNGVNVVEMRADLKNVQAEAQKEIHLRQLKCNLTFADEPELRSLHQLARIFPNGLPLKWYEEKVVKKNQREKNLAELQHALNQLITPDFTIE